MSKTYKLGNGNEFIATSEDTIAEIEKAETELIGKAYANEDPKMIRFYDRVLTDSEYRTKKAVLYVLNGKNHK